MCQKSFAAQGRLAVSRSPQSAYPGRRRRRRKGALKLGNCWSEGLAVPMGHKEVFDDRSSLCSFALP
jgi:hypothetical protein